MQAAESGARHGLRPLLPSRTASAPRSHLNAMVLFPQGSAPNHSQLHRCEIKKGEGGLNHPGTFETQERGQGQPEEGLYLSQRDLQPTGNIGSISIGEIWQKPLNHLTAEPHYIIIMIII